MVCVYEILPVYVIYNKLMVIKPKAVWEDYIHVLMRKVIYKLYFFNLASEQK